MKYYIGVDGGGTKTEFICYDEKGHLVDQVTLSTCHILQVSHSQAVSILTAGINEVIAPYMPVCDSDITICAGLAGYGENKNLKHKIEAICKQSFGNKNFIIKNDAEIALAGALDNEDGIIVIAGTGSIGLAKKGNVSYRCGGWGYMLGDEGSAYWIGKRLLQEYTQQIDGRKERTLLVDYLKHTFSLKDDYELINYVSQTLGNQRNKIAGIAILLEELALKSDPAALEIYAQAGKALAELVNQLSKHFKDTIKVSYIGGVFKSSDLILDPLRNCLQDHTILQSPAHDPAYGAMLIAKNESKRED